MTAPTMKPRRALALAAMAVALVAAAGAPADAVEVPPNDYPTEARADYVFACMQVNGQTREQLQKCSCSIDVIAELMPYAAYEEAETMLAVRQKGGESVNMFLSYAPLLEKINTLRRAQVESELRCF